MAKLTALERLEDDITEATCAMSNAMEIFIERGTKREKWASFDDELERLAKANHPQQYTPIEDYAPLINKCINVLAGAIAEHINFPCVDDCNGKDDGCDICYAEWDLRFADEKLKSARDILSSGELNFEDINKILKQQPEEYRRAMDEWVKSEELKSVREQVEERALHPRQQTL